VVIAPATADIIGKVAAGICDDILACTICATTSPVLFAPAMNDKMYANSIVQDKITYLRSKGYLFVGPVEGHLACGRTGIGHLAPVEDIVKETEKVLRAA
jgi:phosphopantothenoylcysteine decarboxylase/phosphopantothenate--cysteine ligase